MATSTGSASVTSVNYVGFEELRGQGAKEILYGQIFIEPNLPTTAGSGNIAAAGFIPGQQSFLKARRQLGSRSRIARDLELQGFHRIYGI